MNKEIRNLELNFFIFYYICYYLTSGNMERINKLFGIINPTEYSIADNLYNITQQFRKYGFQKRYFSEYAEKEIVFEDIKLGILAFKKNRNTDIVEAHNCLKSSIMYSLMVSRKKISLTTGYIGVFVRVSHFLSTLVEEDVDSLIQNLTDIKKITPKLTEFDKDILRLNLKLLKEEL